MEAGTGRGPGGGAATRRGLRGGIPAFLALALGLAAAETASAWGQETDGGAYINLIVREVRVAPVSARVGDPVRIEVVVENRGEGSDTVPLRVYAGKREVASKLYTYGWSEGDRVTRESFTWDTRGADPGSYRIRAEISVWTDASEFDNELALEEPVVLVPPVQEPRGGTAFTRDPRWRPREGEAEPPKGAGEPR